jgi:hypothetical protein
MYRASTTLATVASACALMATLACTVETPLTPAAVSAPAGATAADGSTLKVGAPVLVSPINDVVLTTQNATLVVNGAAGQFANGSFSYEFQLQDDGGAVVRSAVVSGTSYALPDTLVVNAAFRWRARATLAGAVGPWSSLARFQTPKITNPTASSPDNDWRLWFEALRTTRNVGPTLTVQALLTLDPDLKAAKVIQQTDSAGNPRGRLYLPNFTNDPYARSVDLGNFGGAWQWLPRGATTCEGICK